MDVTFEQKALIQSNSAPSSPFSLSSGDRPIKKRRARSTATGPNNMRTLFFLTNEMFPVENFYLLGFTTCAALLLIRNDNESDSTAVWLDCSIGSSPLFQVVFG